MKIRHVFSFFLATLVTTASQFALGAEQALSFLGSIAPQGFLNHAVTTYVADDPLYQG